MRRILTLCGVAAGLFCATPALAAEAGDQPPPPAAADQSQDMANMPGMAGMPGMANMPGMAGMAGMAGMNMGGHPAPYAGLLGFYPMTRDASGTSWQPDASTHAGLHGGAGAWSTMLHATFNAVYDHQYGPRGAEMGFVSGMVMGAARRDFEDGDVLNLRAMLSPEPPMGPRGYPLLLAAGETADGRTTLVDRQHPHDLFMELSASYTKRLTIDDAVFVYAGLPGEPAFGPPAFMHRASAMDSPEAPITHHWLDSTHITFGVVTAGWVHDAWKLEASRFRGREPDQDRWDIESPRLDSTSARLSWNPTASLALQVSWAHLQSPEALDPTVDERRWSASAIYTVPLGELGAWSTTAAWGRKERSDGVSSDAYLLETAYKPDGAWTFFARAEQAGTDELAVPAGLAHGPLETVGELSLGAIHDWRVGPHQKIGLGGLYAFDFVPTRLQTDYGTDPGGAMLFLRMVID